MKFVYSKQNKYYIKNVFKGNNKIWSVRCSKEEYDKNKNKSKSKSKSKKQKQKGGNMETCLSECKKQCVEKEERIVHLEAKYQQKKREKGLTPEQKKGLRELKTKEMIPDPDYKMKKRRKLTRRRTSKLFKKVPIDRYHSPKISGLSEELSSSNESVESASDTSHKKNHIIDGIPVVPDSLDKMFSP